MPYGEPKKLLVRATLPAQPLVAAGKSLCLATDHADLHKLIANVELPFILIACNRSTSTLGSPAPPCAQATSG